MKIYQGYSYHLKNSFFNLVDDQYLMSNKENNGYRPYFCAIQDAENQDLFWMIPISYKYLKYKKIYDDKIKRFNKCDTIVLGKFDGNQNDGFNILSSGNNVNINHHFISKTDKVLPLEVNNLKPQAISTNFGATISPTAPAQLSVNTDEGVWSFEGYDSVSKIIKQGNEVFTGTWHFQDKDAKDNNLISPIISNNAISLNMEFKKLPNTEYNILNNINYMAFGLITLALYIYKKENN